MSFTDQKPFVVAEAMCGQSWAGGKGGKYFRCGMCGHRFEAGDACRWVYMNSTTESRFGNFLVCEACDGPDVVDRRLAWEQEARTRFWQLLRTCE
jgi:hypothetical protein